METEKIAYGDDDSQFGELHRASGLARGVVVVIHGGFWRDRYDLDLGRPLARDLASRGWHAWNIEYRRVGGGGGFPQTLDDVSRAIDHLAQIEDVPVDRVVTLGHSAGGHLAVWAGGRPADQPHVTVTAAISQAGVLNLRDAHTDDLGDGAALAFMNGPAPAAAAPDDRTNAWNLSDPSAQLPLKTPVWCIHGRQDTNVPLSQSQNYVRAAKSAGGYAELIEVDGDHFVVIDPSSTAWRQTLGILDRLTRPQPVSG